MIENESKPAPDADEKVEREESKADEKRAPAKKTAPKAEGTGRSVGLHR